jgi:Flp pilus assembly protein TadD
MCVTFDRPIGVVALLVVALALAACAGVGERSPFENELIGTLPAEKAVEKGKTHYREGQFGLAEQSYRRAVEQDKNNAEAWLGLAASYDHLKRFDHAGRAYDVVLKLAGRTPAVLNNLGYHYYLRGDLVRARATLMEAKRRDPDNEQVRINLELLDSVDTRDVWQPKVKLDE